MTPYTPRRDAFSLRPLIDPREVYRRMYVCTHAVSRSFSLAVLLLRSFGNRPFLLLVLVES